MPLLSVFFIFILSLIYCVRVRAYAWVKNIVPNAHCRCSASYKMTRKTELQIVHPDGKQFSVVRNIFDRLVLRINNARKFLNIWIFWTRHRMSPLLRKQSRKSTLCRYHRIGGYQLYHNIYDGPTCYNNILFSQKIPANAPFFNYFKSSEVWAIFYLDELENHSILINVNVSAIRIRGCPPNKAAS